MQPLTQKLVRRRYFLRRADFDGDWMDRDIDAFSGHKIEEVSKAAARKPAMYSEGDALSLEP